MTTPRMSAVVVAWNAGSTLAACIDSLRASARSRTSRSSSSSSTTAHATRRRRPAAEGDDVIVRNPVNAGYGVAAAQGIARSDAPWILLVNPDLLSSRLRRSALVDAADQAAPTVRDLVPETAFRVAPGHRELPRPDGGRDRHTGRDRCGHACASTVRAPSIPVARRIERLLPSARRAPAADSEVPSPSFFAYLEDVDLALRLRRAGHEATFVPRARRAPRRIRVHRRALAAQGLPRRAEPATALPFPRPVVTARARLAHAGRRRPRRYSSVGTPVAPWSGRFHAFGLHRYSTFLRRARTLTSLGSQCRSRTQGRAARNVAPEAACDGRSS